MIQLKCPNYFWPGLRVPDTNGRPVGGTPRKTVHRGSILVVGGMGLRGVGSRQICRFISCVLRACSFLDVCFKTFNHFYSTSAHFQGSVKFKKMKLMEKERSVKRRYVVYLLPLITGFDFV